MLIRIRTIEKQDVAKHLHNTHFRDVELGRHSLSTAKEAQKGSAEDRIMYSIKMKTENALLEEPYYQKLENNMRPKCNPTV